MRITHAPAYGVGAVLPSVPSLPNLNVPPEVKTALATMQSFAQTAHDSAKIAQDALNTINSIVAAAQKPAAKTSNWAAAAEVARSASEPLSSKVKRYAVPLVIVVALGGVGYVAYKKTKR